MWTLRPKYEGLEKKVCVFSSTFYFFSKIWLIFWSFLTPFTWNLWVCTATEYCPWLSTVFGASHTTSIVSLIILKKHFFSIFWTKYVDLDNWFLAWEGYQVDLSCIYCVCIEPKLVKLSFEEMWKFEFRNIGLYIRGVPSIVLVLKVVIYSGQTWPALIFLENSKFFFYKSVR